MKTLRIVALLELLVIVLLASFVLKYKGDSDKNWMDYQRQVGITEMNERLYEDGRADYEEQMAVLRGMVDSANTILAEKEEAIAGKEADIGKLEQLRPLLSDKDAIIANLDQQIEVYKKVVVDFKLVVEQKDRIIFSLTEQVRVQGQRLETAEALFQAEKSLRLSAERGWSLERSRTEILRKQGRLSRSVAVGSLTAVGVAQVSGASAGASLLSGLVTSVVTYFIWK